MLLKKIFKLIIVTLMLLGVAFSVMNFFPGESKALHGVMGTLEADGGCTSFKNDC